VQHPRRHHDVSRDGLSKTGNIYIHFTQKITPKGLRRKQGCSRKGSKICQTESNKSINKMARQMEGRKKKKKKRKKNQTNKRGCYA